MVPGWSGVPPIHFAGARWLLALFGTVVFFYGGLVFVQVPSAS